MMYQKKTWNHRFEKSGRQQLLSTVVSHTINLQLQITYYACHHFRIS